MINYDEQIKRIKTKLHDAKKADYFLKVSGANSHNYKLNPPATLTEVESFEKKYSVNLPGCYRSFVLSVGNGGDSFSASGAGPYYGIYPLGKNVDELIDNPGKGLRNDCLIYPKMTDEYWTSLTENIYGEDETTHKCYDEELTKVYGGILPIGSQGCSYLHAIILNGQFRGKVVNVDLNGYKPKFCFEANFLDWYERWLDEVISGELINDGPNWFGYAMGGPDAKLLEGFLNTETQDEKEDFLIGLLKKRKLEKSSIQKIEQLLSEPNNPFKSELIEILCKSDYSKAKPYLLELLKTDVGSVFEIIFRHAKNRSRDWLTAIEQNILRITDDKTFMYCIHILFEAKIDYSHIVIPFTKHNNPDIRSHAFYALGKLAGKQRHLDIFIDGLQDNSTKVIHSTLQALEGLKNKKLLHYYKLLAEKFPIEQDFILSNLNRRLTESGLTIEEILSEETRVPDLANNKTKKWYHLWK